ncbi:hypothetical protein PLESTB_001288800 [Pleodorina starrii]|uniref:Uncharacterized protein n=1 Tax=Pleodorina starrii TaxID=330485 RepID=A0A9W6F6S5_9CHLO|nr:hypothetical protein PLESTM_000833900 [Pleodorina starrii]GLC57915.1 hypothetical protein PLESTB_001288800 [Pleodorina starrii]GLC67096.1 hypothetical protein PLESTF_000514700 [Pleodorina starrii]
MSEKPLHVLVANVTAACSRFQAVLADEPHSVSAPQPPASQHPSVVALTQLLREHEELLLRLSSNDQPGGGRGDDQAEAANVAAKRERVLTQGLNALGFIAVTMRAVLDDVGELAPADNGYLPNVQEILSYGHRLRYTTFATMGLYSGEPAPQQLHLDHAALWERALAERHQQMAANAAAAGGAAAAAAAAEAAAEVPVDPRAEAACRALLDNLVAAGWTPEAGFPEPVLAFLSDMPGALDVLRRLGEERFSGKSGGQGEQAAAPPPPPARKAPAAAPAADPSSRLVRELMLDEDSDDGGGRSSEYTTTEDESD